MLGIRAGSGNVMLYGPAGTGKTIMCQAAAYEAKAELIIGIVTILHYKTSSVVEIKPVLNHFCV